MDELLQLYLQTHNAIEAATAELRAQIEALQVQLAAAEAPYRQTLEELRAEIRPMAEALGCSHTAHGVEVAYRRGYTRTSWDNKGLDRYARQHPDVLQHRRQIEVAPLVTIRVVPPSAEAGAQPPADDDTLAAFGF